mmetsp:Transcript_11751/g.35237  ORF Transcript_11751/g.35237 Transcript_11751/m.35237 type:complete len:254 (+) Transcript_11751:288-1049(+)
MALALEDLFVDRDYEPRRYEIGNVAATVLCLRAATTDHDLTGQVVWPVSVLLACFLEKSGVCAGKNVVEVGAGAGLPGVVAASSAAGVALTDGNSYVLDMLRQTAARQTFPVAVEPLVWGDKRSLDDFLRTFPRVDVVVGADVVAWPNSVAPLLQTVAGLLVAGDPASLPRRRFYCGFVSRARSTERLFFQLAADYGFVVADVPFHYDDQTEESPILANSALRVLELHLPTPPSFTFLSEADPDRFHTMPAAC